MFDTILSMAYGGSWWQTKSYGRWHDGNKNIQTNIPKKQQNKKIYIQNNNNKQ